MSICTSKVVTEVEVHREPNENKVEMKTYILDDLKALKKKFSMINHSPPIDVNGEASNGASINVDMKTSIFELMKNGLVEYLKKESDIQKIEFPVTSKAQSKNGEEADVEYHVEITFVVAGIVEKIKMKCFTTNCRIQVQNFGKHVRKDHLGKEHSPKYFVQRFIVPFLESVKEDALRFDNVFVPHLRTEIQRLQKRKIQDKVRKGSALETDPKNAKCVNTICQWVNVTLKNVEAYGTCETCQGFEHYHCAGTSKMMKEEIKNGKANFICTVCLEKNPALGKQIVVTSKQQKAIEQGIVPQNISNDILSLTDESNVEVNQSNVADDDAKENPTKRSEPESNETENIKCKVCEYVCAAENELILHVAEHHPVQNNTPQVECTTCGKQFTDEGELNIHVQMHVSEDVQCDKCDYKSDDRALLATHMEFAHDSSSTFKCDVCNNCFQTELDLKEHKKVHEEASVLFQCDICTLEVTSNTDLEKHMSDNHTDSNSVNTNKEHDDQHNSPLEDMNMKFKMMEESYDRLMALYSKQQNDFKAKTLAYKSELENVYDTLRATKVENEKLKEVNETQHKLWKIFLDKFEDKDTKTKNDKEGQTNGCDKTSTKSGADEEILIVDDDCDNDDVTEEAYQAWLKDTRKRGFKRSSPSSPPERIQNNNKTDISYAEVVASGRQNSEKQNHNIEKPKQDFVRYCHNWNNLGKCNFENCRFAHENAPICSFDGNCTRQKCMFSHKKQNMHFLAKKFKPQTNPWQTMGGSWPNPFSLSPNPWNNPSTPNPWNSHSSPNPWNRHSLPNPWNNPPQNRRK